MADVTGCARGAPDTGGGSIVGLFEASAARFPDKTAFIAGDGRLTYSEIDLLSNRAARRLVEMSGTDNRPVAALFDDGVRVPVAMLAILKAGKAYVPLSAAYPPSRLTYMLDESEAPAIVTDAAHAALAAGLAGGRAVVNLDAVPVSLPDGPLGLPCRPDDLACILYTSGSTGEPKGIVNTHRQFFLTATTQRNPVGLAEDGTILLFGSFAASGPTRSSIWPLTMGATCRVGARRDIDRIPEIIAAEGVTLFHGGPSFLARFLESYDGRPLPTLRFVYVSGEPFQRALLERFFDAFPSGVPIMNGFGLGETGAATGYLMRSMPDFEGSLVPVGFPISGVTVRILDESRNDVAPGEVGEIAIACTGVADGYWKKPELTRQRFVTDSRTGERTCLSGDLGRWLPDGSLLHIGRMDNSVKVRGFSVDLAEVEGALRAHPSIKAATADARPDRAGDLRVIGYIVPGADGPLDPGALRRFVASRLPEYMVPSAFVMLDRLPMTIAGKLDRRALPDADSGRPALVNAFVAPRTPVEEILARIWGDCLGLDEVGVEDDFFELGGHSLAAARIISCIGDELAIYVELQTLLAARTVAALSPIVTAGLLEAAGDASLD